MIQADVSSARRTRAQAAQLVTVISCQALICRATGWPRSSVYHDAAPADDEGRLRRALGRLAARWPTYGYRRLTAMLRREGCLVHGKRVRRLMAEMGA